jgi:hypothetical protein
MHTSVKGEDENASQTYRHLLSACRLSLRPISPSKVDRIVGHSSSSDTRNIFCSRVWTFLQSFWIVMRSGRPLGSRHSNRTMTPRHHIARWKSQGKSAHRWIMGRLVSANNAKLQMTQKQRSPAKVDLLRASGQVTTDDHIIRSPRPL